MLFPEGELVKMKIKAYTKVDFSEANAVEDGEHTLLINPENFKENYTISYKLDQPKGSDGKELVYETTKPGEFTIKILLDSTGIFETLKPSEDAFKAQLQSLIPSEFSKPSIEEDKGISEDVAKLKKILFAKNESTHEPSFIKINWADLEVKCRIKKVDIDYKLFNQQGHPIRALVSLTCINTIAEDIRKATTKENSPDLTHIRVVKEGDTLPLMTYKIYGDPKYYLEVARVNNILNFRNLNPGQEIIFPPLEK